MEAYRVEPHIGEFIRQARRQQNLTQTQLGGIHYSKSYVSAVERNKILPSSQALIYFAEQLGQASEYFSFFLQKTENTKKLLVLNEQDKPSINEQTHNEEEVTLLDFFLENTEYYDVDFLPTIPTISEQALATLPIAKQARYYFLMGLIARNTQDFSQSVHAFEFALVLSPIKQQPAILDELGYTYSLMHSYHTALNYHLRALHLIQQGLISDNKGLLQFRVELHCGIDYQALGVYKKASEYYEYARKHLNSQGDMKTAGLLYLGLGYCANAYINQTSALAIPQSQRATPENVEHDFQSAIIFLVQARSIYQVSRDFIGEANTRLTLAMTDLNFSNRRMQIAKFMTENQGKPFSANCTSLLEDAEEQCRQILLTAQEPLDDAISSQLDEIIYLALASLIRVALQRAMFARFNALNETAYRERSQAAYLCQRVLDTLSDNSYPLPLIQDILSSRKENIVYISPSVPRLACEINNSKSNRSPVSLSELYFAAGAVAEELGRVAQDLEYARDCYVRANQWYDAALSQASSAVLNSEYDQGYLYNCYQRTNCLLEERLLATPELWEETAKTHMNTFKNGLYALKSPLI